MDIALANSITHVATQMGSARTADAVDMLVLKKALDQQEASASTLIQTLLPSTGLATSGALGTQVNTWA